MDGMDSFAFIIHPIDPKRDAARKFPRLANLLTEKQINFLSTFFPPLYISEIEGVQSEATGKEVKGWFLACPYTPNRMLELPERMVYKKIIQTGRMAEKLGARILGLGAFTSVVGDGGITIARELDIPVTTGDAYTIATAVEAVKQAAEVMEIPLKQAAAAVVGAGGAIGRVCAGLLAGQVGRLTMIGRTEASLQEAAAQVQAGNPGADVRISTDIRQVKDAQIIITVTSAVEAIIEPELLQPGSIVCDVARPRDVSARVAQARDDVLVIDGGMVEVPGKVNFNFDFGFPPGKAFACMAETMALALEGRFEDYTLGKHITRDRVEEISAIARRHGFRLSGFRSFERAVTPAQIDHVRLQAKRRSGARPFFTRPYLAGRSGG